MEELCDSFSLERVGKSGAKFDFDKTKWFNQQYLRAKSKRDLAQELQVILKTNEIEVDNEYVELVCEQLKQRATFTKDMWEEGKYYFLPPTEYDAKTIRKKWEKETSKFLTEFKNRLESITDFKAENIELAFKEYLQERNLAMGKLLPAFRISLTGLGTGPSLFDIASLLGKSETIKRLETALKNIS